MASIVAGTGQADPSDTDAWIQEICDSLHRLEALISATVPIPPEQPAAAKHGFVYLGQSIDWEGPEGQH
jgi:hypothetical protein